MANKQTRDKGADRIVHKPLRGVVLLALAVLCFASMDAMMKYLTIRYNVPLVIAVRYIGNLVLMLAILGPRLGSGLYRTRRTGPVILRACCLSMASLASFLAVSANRILPVAESTAIIYLAPLGVMLLAGPLLGERVSLTGWLAAAAGFAGILLIVRPGAELPTVGILFALSAAAVTVVYQLMSRTLAATESTVALLFHSALESTHSG